MYKCCTHITLKRPLNKSRAMALMCPLYSWPGMLKVAPRTYGYMVVSLNFFGLMGHYFI